jgi:two-component system, LytTR family, sensor histidine kinase AlgZ
MHDVEADFEAGLQKGEGAQPPIYVVRLAVPLPASSRGVPAA